jgi:transcriptional regulator with XRE-family HTH domain
MSTEYGLRLRSARQLAGLTQGQLSKLTGIAQSTISTAERLGKGSTETAVFARVCNVDAHWLATGDGEMHSSSYSTSNIKFSTGDGQAPIAKALEALDRHLKELAPVLQDPGREVLRKWAIGLLTTSQVADVLEALNLASESMANK